MSTEWEPALERLRAVADSQPELSKGETYVLRDDLRALLAHLAKMEHQAARADRALKVLRDLAAKYEPSADSYVAYNTSPAAAAEWRAVAKLLASEGT